MNGELNIDFRHRPFVFKNGKLVLHQPIRKIENCFDVEDVTWTVSVWDNTWLKMIDLEISSQLYEKAARKSGDFNFRVK